METREKTTGKGVGTEFPSFGKPYIQVVEREERLFVIKGWKLRALRKGKNMSLRQFAENLTNKIGIIYDHRHVDRWERSASFSVDLKTMEAIINIGGCSTGS